MFGQPIDYYNYVNTPNEFKSRNFIKVDKDMKKTVDGFAIKTFFKDVETENGVKEYMNIIIYLGFTDGTFTYFKSPSNSMILGQFCKEYNIVIDNDKIAYDYYPIENPVSVVFNAETKMSKKTNKPYPVFWVSSVEN